MTYEEREKILSKEAISYKDLGKLLDICDSMACQKMKEIKRVQGDRLQIQGKLHIQDYLEYYQIPKESMIRYRKIEKFEDEGVMENEAV